MLQIKQPRRAQRCLELAVRAQPDCTAGHLLLGRALLAGGPEGPIRGPTLDVVNGPQGDPAAALRPLRRAADLAPDRDDTAAALAIAYQRAGDTSRALAALDRCPSSVLTTRTRADVLDAVGRGRGAHLRVESDEIVQLRSDALAERPDPTTRQRLVRHLVLQGDFDQAFCAADPEAMEGGRRRWDSVVDDSDFLSQVNDDWLYVAAAVALDEGDCTQVHRIKRTIAARVIGRGLHAVAPASAVTGLVRAVAYSSGERDAVDELDQRRSGFATHSERLAYDKLDADLRVALGDVERLVAVRERLATVNPESEQRFRALIRDARIAVIGPSDFGTFTPEELDTFDVIVSTKRPTDTLSGRPTISYRSDTNVRFDLLPALGQGADLATIEVLRPSMLVNGASVPGHHALRVMSAEDTNTFLGTHFGIQRILYDLVGRGAESITLAGVDFFLSETPYVKGYDDEMTRVYEPNQLQPARSRAAHDHGWDFRFTKLLAGHGLIQPHPDVQRLLDYTVDDYLVRLSEVARRRPRESQLLR